MNDHEDIREVTGVCDVIESLAITGAPESTGVTTFVQEACTAVSAVNSEFSFTPYPVQSNLQDVREYFRRPVAINNGTVPSTRTRFFSVTPAFSTILTYWNTGFERLKGAYGIRAKIVLTLQVAATPFHQGLICLSNQYGYSPGAVGVYERAKDSCTATNLPHVVLDLSSDTSVQLHVPFLFTAEYCSIRPQAAEPVYSQFSINNLCTVPSVSGMNPPTYQLYIHLEDIELFGATPQVTNNVTVNAGRKLSPVTEEFENDAFPFSSALHSAGKAISFVAKGVPSLSSIGGPVSWALGKAAGVVRYFGYGKPAVIDPVMRMQRVDTIGEFNTDVATSSLVLAATAANTTSINTHVGASDVDEMALKYITSRWSQIYVFGFNVLGAPGQLLYATPINMLAFWFRDSAGNGNKLVSNVSTASSNSVQPSHLMFAASSFKQWRGGIKFRFTFAKTKMHAGRIMVAFNPYLTTVDSTTLMTSPTAVTLASYGTLGPDPFGYSAIFDLKDGNVFEFKIPYVSPTPYVNITTTVGSLAMYVVNPLVGSTVISTSINCIVQVAGDVDFELANPAGIMFPVHNAGTIRLNAGRVLSEAPEVINQLTMGECITSVKQLIAIPDVSNQVNTTPLSLVQTPWYYQPTPSVLTPPVGVIPAWGGGYGGNWASCYAFLKGGTDVHAYTGDNVGFLTLVQLPNANGYLAGTATPDSRNVENAPTLITARGSLHARLPGFFPISRIFSWVYNNLSVSGNNIAANPFSAGSLVSPYQGIQAVYAITSEPARDTRLYVSRNAADDAQLAHYYGPPPVFLPAASAPGNYIDASGVTISFAP